VSYETLNVHGDEIAYQVRFASTMTGSCQVCARAEASELCQNFFSASRLLRHLLSFEMAAVCMFERRTHVIVVVIINQDSTSSRRTCDPATLGVPPHAVFCCSDLP
jgi:hypothetical protein